CSRRALTEASTLMFLIFTESYQPNRHCVCNPKDTTAPACPFFKQITVRASGGPAGDRRKREL
ncbi:MAG: hypothetical protein AB7J13_11705, partial [Pyrinomonadaceae bacterium]